MNPLQVLETRWQAWWPELAPREQRLVIGSAVLVVLALTWWIALAPALRTLARAPAEHARLDAQLQQMSSLQSQARALQAQPRANHEASLRALEASVNESLGAAARMQPSGTDAVGIAIRGVPADALGQWFAQARANARAVPREAHLTRGQAAPGATGPASAPAAARPTTGEASGGPPAISWDGTLVLSLPAQ